MVHAVGRLAVVQRSSRQSLAPRCHPGVSRRSCSVGTMRARGGWIKIKGLGPLVRWRVECENKRAQRAAAIQWTTVCVPMAMPQGLTQWPHLTQWPRLGTGNTYLIRVSHKCMD